MKPMRLLLLALGGLAIGDTLLLACFSNLNLGVVLPAIIGMPLLAIGIFYGWFLRLFQTPLGKWIKAILIGGYGAYALFMLVVSGLIYTQTQEEAPKDADALIVLGCGVHGERVSLTLKYRLDKAIEYLHLNPNTVAVLSGGQGPGEDITEAEAMGRYLVRNGIDESRIRKEGNSTSTYENFAFSMEIISEEFGKTPKLVFITTGFHVLRAELVAKQQGIEISGIAASDVPYMAANNYMREAVALTLYKLMGRV